MSTFTQFFPTGGGGGGGGGNETPGGFKIPQDGIPVEILGVSGSGGRGASPGYTGSGGSGAVFHANNYHVQPGCTVPITIGGGGAVGGCPCGQGTQGGTTSFNYSLKPIGVEGGGGGGTCCDGPPSSNGCPGGNGGQAMCGVTPTQNCNCSCGGEGLYHTKKNSFVCSQVFCCPSSTSVAVIKDSDAQFQKEPWGHKAGFPASNATYKCCWPGWVCNASITGTSGGNATFVQTVAAPGCSCCIIIPGQYYRSGISGTMTEYNAPGTFGYSAPGSAGCPGGLIIQWATAFGAAPPTGFPGAVNISPQTPGYYTYCFTSSGSIEIP